MNYLLILLACPVLSININSFFDKPTCFLTTCELLEKYGYPCEPHKVITEDGYILQHFRVPYGRSNSNITNKPVVLLQHGLMGTSNHWLYQEPPFSLGYILANAGYDVWLMNTRGNSYSNKHIKNINKSDYWNFSWHELGLYDIPNTIDYVLNVTKQNNVLHCGHSQGTTSMYVMLSEKPEYNQKILTHISYSPVALNEHLNSILFKLMKPFESIQMLTTYREVFGDFDFIPESWFLKTMSFVFCQPYMPSSYFCKYLSYKLYGYSPTQLDSTTLPLIFCYFPAGASFKESVHYVQLSLAGKFQKYDNGKTLNMKIYGTSKPPAYDVNKIEVPIYAFYGQEDALAPAVDVERFLPMLPSLVTKYKMENCSHNDFLVGNVAQIMYAETLTILRKYNNVV